jgi:hypothetical protein
LKTWLLQTNLLTSFSEVFEKVIYERLPQHSNVNNILVEEQFGFRPVNREGILQIDK